MNTKLAVLVAATLLLAPAGQAVAAVDERGRVAEEAGALVARLAPSATDAAVGQVTSARGRVAVSLPRSSDQPVTLGAGGVSVGLGLPEQAEHHSAQTLPDGKVVFVDPASPVQVVTEQVDAISARTVVVLADASAPTEYRFDLRVPEGSTLVKQADGGVHVLDAQGEVLAQVAAPWAKDAAGAAVATAYRVDGGTLVQEVRPSADSEFPVVADPKITYGLGVYLNLWGYEARAIGTALALLIAGGAIAACTASNIPAGVAYLVKLICSAGVGSAAWEVLKNLNDWIRGGNFNNNTCYQKKIIPNTGGWVGVDRKNCS